MAASSISSTQFSPTSQLSQADSPRPQQADPNAPARPQLGAAAQELTSPPSDSGRGRNVDVVA